MIQNSKFKIQNFILLILFLMLQIYSFAQCAMCKAGAEQSLEKGSTDANWINYGIIFLMTVPLILIFALYRLYKYNQKAD